MTAPVLAVAVALYPVAVSVEPCRSTIALGVAVLGVTLTSVLTATVLYPSFLAVPNPKFDTDLFSSLGFSWFTIGLSWALGCRLRAHREYNSQIAEYRARQVVSEERLRIAREMHDVVAHSVGVIAMKAAVANHVYDTRPQESRDALGVIESVGRAALADIEGVLGVLRSESEADLAPSPGLDELPGLIENVRLADVQVKLDRGSIPALPAAVQLSAYQIVQGDADKHYQTRGNPSPVHHSYHCRVRRTAPCGDRRRHTVRPAGEPGHGLIGMRERAALHHGTLVAGWQLHAGSPCIPACLTRA